MLRRSHRENSRRNRKRFAQQTRARQPTNRAQPAAPGNRRPDRRNPRAKCRQEQFSETVPESSTPVPREIGRFLNAEDGEAAGESRQRVRSDRQPTAEKKKRRE